MRGLKFFVGVAGLMMVAASIYHYWSLVRPAEDIPIISSIAVTETLAPTSEPSTMPSPENLNRVVLTETVTTPQPILVRKYLLGDSINLSSGSTALTIKLDQENYLPGNWAEAVSYKDNDPVDIFDPHNGTIYSVLEETVIIQAHSGSIYKKPILFASNIDLYLRKEGKQLINLVDGQKKLESLVGKTAFLCQTDAGTMEKFSYYDATRPCQGQQLELKIVAVGFVPQTLVTSYYDHSSSLLNWLTMNMPDANFSSLDPKTGFLLVTCVGRYPDQVIIKDLPDYDYNRLVIGFEIVH